MAPGRIGLRSNPRLSESAGQGRNVVRDYVRVPEFRPAHVRVRPAHSVTVTHMASVAGLGFPLARGLSVLILWNKCDYPSTLQALGSACLIASSGHPRTVFGMPPSRTVDSSAPRDMVPDWFLAFLDDRQTRKPSAHTMKAYRQDFDGIASLLTEGNPAGLLVTDITSDTVRIAFARYARTHEPATIRRCWSTWNVLCTYLYTAGLLVANPMPLVGKPKVPKILPKSLPLKAIEALLAAVTRPSDKPRSTDWPERDLAIILTPLLAGVRASELIQLNIGDIRTVDDGSAVIHVKGKGGKDRSIPVEASLLSVIERYLVSRATRIPDERLKNASASLTDWPPRTPLFVDRDGNRMTNGVLQSRIKRAFKLAGPEAQPVEGALVHGFRHTYATELANADVSVYTLMKLLGHESMNTSQRYVSAAGSETRSAAAQNPLYRLVRDTSESQSDAAGTPSERL